MCYNDFVLFSTLSGYAAVLFLDDNTLVVYECDHRLSNTQCDPLHTHVDVYSRTREPLDDQTGTKLLRIAALMCLRTQYFEQVQHDGKQTFFSQQSIMLTNPLCVCI